MIRVSAFAVASLLLATPAIAQPMDHSKMPGMKMPAAPENPKTPAAKPRATAAQAAPARPRARPAQPPKRPANADAHAGHQMPAGPAAAPTPSPTDPHAGHNMPAASTAPPAAVDPHAGHQMPAVAAPARSTEDPHAGHSMPGTQTAGAEPAIPDTPPPPAPTDHAAELFYAPEVMAGARAQLRREHGGGRFSQVMARFAEYQVRDGDDGYRWDVEAWYGGDINRFVLKAEGEGGLREGVDEAEVQTLYSRAVGPYFDLQAGLRYDFEPGQRTYATLGFEGLAPYWFEVEGAAFLSDRGDLSARFEATYDLRLTQQLILQPHGEVNLALQDVPEAGTGSGVSDAELSLRLRYEIRREFAPYIGVSWQRKFGGSADFARAAGEGVTSTSLVVGLRGWF